MNIIDLCFPVTGSSAPRDHGYPLYSALCRTTPRLHEARWLGVHPLSGRVANDVIMFGSHSELQLRLPAECIPIALPLAGARLELAGSALVLGAPSVRALQPRPSLDARTVLLKLTSPPTRESDEEGRTVLDNGAMAERYRAELHRQLKALGIESAPELCGRRSVTVGGKRIVGYSVRVSGLSADQSLALQAQGLGGKRRMGCGIFRATRGA